MDSLRALVHKGASRRVLSAFCDALEEDDRIAAVLSLGRGDLARLWELAATDDPGETPLSQLVPDSLGAGESVWAGVNSLFAFRHFAKHFRRASEAGLLWGYNQGAAQGIVGPGYFAVTVCADDPRVLLLDYTRAPPEAPPGWPRVRDNGAGLARFVFAGMRDRFRPLGRDAGVGAAYLADGSPRGQFFALARRPSLPSGG